MAWSIVGVSAIVEVTATSHALTEPAGVAQGDLLVAVIVSRIASTTSITLPTGGAWTLVGEQKANNVLTTSSALPSAMMAYCIRGASAPNYTFTHPTAPSVAIGQVIAYRGGVTASVLDVNTAATTATNVTAVSVTGLTTTVANDLIVALAAGGQEANWSSFNATTPSGASGATDTTTAPSAAWRERADNITTTGADTSLGVFDALKTAAGATGNLTVTASVAAGHSIVAGAFKIAVPISVNVTGQSATASIGLAGGTVGTGISASVTGRQATASVGTVGIPTFVSVTGLTATASLGPPPQRISFAIGGPIGASFSSGTAARQYMGSAGYVAEVDLAVSPVSVVITAGGGVSVSVAGLAATASIGAATVGTAANVSAPVTGLTATASLGTVTVGTAANISIPITGFAAATLLGPPIQLRSFASGGPLGVGFVSETSARQYMGTTGYVAETAQIYPVSVITTAGASVSANVIGQLATTALGAVTLVGKANASVTGLSGTASLGAISASAGGSISASVTGQFATGFVGAVTVTAIGGVGVWNGSTWVKKPAKVWSGSAWQQKPVKHWSGSAWV